MNKFLSRIFILAFLFVYSNSFSQANFLQWAKSIGSVNNDIDGNSKIRIDSKGDVYIASIYKGTMDADPGLGVVNVALTGTLTQSTFLSKYDKDGNFIWVKTWHGTNLVISDFEIDSIGQIILGVATGTLDLDPGVGVTTNYSSGILKLDSLGDFKWYKTLRNVLSSSSAGVGQIALDKQGNILACGEYYSQVDFNPGSGTNALTGTFYTYTDPVFGPGSAYRKHLFCWKLTANGVYVFANDVGSNTSDNYYPTNNNKVNALDIEADSLGACYVLIGNFTIGGGSTIILNSRLIKFDGSGVAGFNYFLGSEGKKLAVGKGVFVTMLSGFNNNTNKYDLVGNGIWTKNLGAYNVKTDRNGDLYFMDGNHISTKYDNDGNLLWTSNFGTNFATTDFDIDNLGNVVWSGYFNPTASFTVNAVPLTLTTKGNYDHCFGKLSNCVYNAPNICLVSVDSLAQNNVIYWDKTPFANADSFIVYRYDAFAMIYKRIGAKSINQANFLIDTARTVGGPNGGDPQYSSSRYKLAIRGVCGVIGTQGLYHQSIFIQQNNQNFSWNAYGIEGQSSPATGYQFMRDNTNTGTWQVLVNTGGLSTTDPNYLSYPNGNWRVDALGFTCNPTAKLNPNAAVNKSKSNVKNNFVVTSASELELNANVLLSPNPAKTELTVNFSNHQLIKTEFTIADVLGKVISKIETQELDKIVIPLYDISTGVYFLKIKQGKLQVIKKFVKQ